MCEHRNYTILDKKKDWITADCDDCGAHLLFILDEVQEVEE